MKEASKANWLSEAVPVKQQKVTPDMGTASDNDTEDAALQANHPMNPMVPTSANEARDFMSSLSNEPHDVRVAICRSLLINCQA